MTAGTAFILGVCALPIAASALLILSRVFVAVWDELEKWVRSVKPHQVREVYSYDVATGRTKLWVSKRAPLLASLGASKSIYFWKALPGFVVVVARDAKDNPATRDSEALIRDALCDISVEADS